MITIGSVVGGKYRLVRLLGDGGMGSVYEALHTGLGSRVAVKVLHPELGRRTGLIERFLQEARVAAQIRSPHVVHVTDVDRTPEGDAYIVMDLLEGEPLSGMLDRQRKLSPPVACEYAVQILEALEAAHALGVIHRDLKPENVFVTFASGKPVLKLIDFGIAKARRTDEQKNLTVAGVVMGTAEYMAPEQARSADKVDARADVYAVGVMLYEMIAGSRPVTGEDARVVAFKVERGEAVPLLRAAPEAPRELAGLVHRAMAARPELRFASATEMRLAVEEVMTGKRAATAGMAAAQAAPRSVRMATPVAPEIEPPVSTVRAPPMATAILAPGLGAPLVPGGPGAGGARARQRRGKIAALVALPVLVGAAVVGILVATGHWGSATEPPSSTAQPTAQTTPTVAPEAVPTTTDTRGNEVPALIPARPAPAAPRPPSARASADAEAAPPAVADAAPPSPLGLPTSFPSTLPPFPSGLPFPAGFPTSFPGLPSAFPGWPPPAQPAPAPTRAPPAKGTNGTGGAAI
jgi:eukaryotic-like serine/threonine-protein kinase